MKKVSIDSNSFEDVISKIYEEEKFKLTEAKWKSFAKNEKIFIIQFLKENSKPKKGVILEAKWYNTIGDIVGVFDPTGVVDVVNAISYFKQGDNLFGILSLISAVPYVGDVFAKPVIGVLKSGKGLSKTMRGATKASDWVILGKKYPIIGGLLKKTPAIGEKLLKMVEAVPLGKQFTGVVKKWVGKDGLFTQAAKGLRGGVNMSAKAGTITAKDVSILRNYGINPNWNFFKRAWKRGGLFKNRQVSRLLRDTKWWLGFVDYAGFGNFVGPEEVEDLMGKENFDKRMEQYMETSDAKTNWESEMSQFVTQTPTSVEEPKTTQSKPKESIMDDPIMKLFFPSF